MFITRQDIRAYGFRIENAVPDAAIDLAIEEAEGCIRQAVGGAEFARLIHIDFTEPIIRGGEYNDTYIGGVSKAAAYIANAFLVQRDYVTTAFGNVQKKDEHSQQVEALKRARQDYQTGWQYLIESLDAYGIKWRSVNNIFAEGRMI